MPTYKYATKNNELKEFEAQDSKSALGMLSSFGDVAKGSGIQEVKTPAPALSNISTPAPAPSTTPDFVPPEPTAPQTEEDFVLSVSEEAKQSRESLENRYKDEISRIDSEKEQSQKRIDELNEQQLATIETDIEPLLSPFREELENTERKRLYVDENFQANQTLTRELDRLLTEGNQLIESRRDQPVALSVLNKRVSKTLADVNARAGVIQAVMSARTGQIAEAYRMIDRSVAAITADRQDQLNYYNTLLAFYEDQRDEEGNKLLNLEKDQKDFLTAQIGLLESDLTKAEENAQNIKDAMTDPDTALLYAQAGVTLNDTQEEIGKKVAEASYAKEVVETSNEMAQDGYTYLAPGQVAPVGAETVTITDSKGKEKTFYKQDKSVLSVAEAKSLGVPYGTTAAEAQRMGIVPGGGDGGDDDSEFALAEAFVGSKPEATDDELKAALLRDSDLSVSEINAVIAARKKEPTAPPDPTEVATKIENILTPVKDTYSRAEAEDLAKQQLKTALDLGADDSLPSSYEEAIKDALVNVYGKTFWQSVIPGGR